jgi:hypothetical protein
MNEQELDDFIAECQIIDQKRLIRGIVPTNLTITLETLIKYIKSSILDDKQRSTANKILKSAKCADTIYKMVKMITSSCFELVWKPRCELTTEWQKRHHITPKMKMTYSHTHSNQNTRKNRKLTKQKHTKMIE